MLSRAQKRGPGADERPRPSSLSFEREAAAEPAQARAHLPIVERDFLNHAELNPLARAPLAESQTRGLPRPDPRAVAPGRSRRGPRGWHRRRHSRCSRPGAPARSRSFGRFALHLSQNWCCRSNSIRRVPTLLRLEDRGGCETVHSQELHRGVTCGWTVDNVGRAAATKAVVRGGRAECRRRGAADAAGRR
jgi:hypothetical protein